MSWNIAFAAKGRDDAKTDLKTRNKEAGSHMPAAVEKGVAALIDAMPDTGMEGYNTLNVATYGHMRGDDPGASNVTVQLMWTADVNAEPTE